MLPYLPSCRDTPGGRVTIAATTVTLQGRFAWADFMLDPRPGGLLSVVAGPYDDGAEAQRVARRLQQSGVTSLVRRWRK